MQQTYFAAELPTERLVADEHVAFPRRKSLKVHIELDSCSIKKTSRELDTIEETLG